MVITAVELMVVTATIFVAEVSHCLVMARLLIIVLLAAVPKL